MKYKLLNNLFSKKKLRKTLTILAFLSLWIVGFSALFVYAIGQTFAYSFTNYNLMNLPKWVGIANYVGLLKDQVFWETLGNTFYFVIILVPGILTLSFIFAVMCNTNAWLGQFGSIAYFLPFVIPLAATGLVWRWIFNSQYGIFNYLLSIFGLSGPSWLVSSVWVKPAIIIAQITLLGQFLIIFIAALQDIPKSLYEAAEIDGATPLKKTLYITVPMVSPAILFNLITSLIMSFQIFEVPYIMTLNAGATMQAKADRKSVV